MKLLEVLTPQPGIYHDCYNHNTFLEDNLKPVNMKNGGRQSVRKHNDIKNGEQYTILDIFYKLDCTENREATSSESRYYTGRPGKGMTTSLALSTRIQNKKKRCGPSQDIPFFVTPYFVSELKSFKSIISTHFPLIYLSK